VERDEPAKPRNHAGARPPLRRTDLPSYVAQQKGQARGPARPLGRALLRRRGDSTARELTQRLAARCVALTKSNCGTECARNRFVSHKHEAMGGYA